MKNAPVARLREILEEIAPLHLASSWDNVGWITSFPEIRQISGVLLCVDLTLSVVAEARMRKCNLIVAYHPPIFKPLNRLDHSVPMHAAILQAIRSGISLYSPHTALDAAPGGLNDWLAGAMPGAEVERIPGSSVRVARMQIGASPRALARRISQWLQSPVVRLVAGRRPDKQKVLRSIAICAGAGHAALQHVRDVDAWLTGEMGHHDLLAARESGISVFLTEHTRTERPFLPVYAARIRSLLAETIPVQVAVADAEILAYHLFSGNPVPSGRRR